LFPFHKRKSMFAELHSDIKSPKSGPLHLTGQPYCKKSRSAKVRDGIINLFLRNNLIDRWYNNDIIVNTHPLERPSWWTRERRVRWIDERRNFWKSFSKTFLLLPIRETRFKFGFDHSSLTWNKNGNGFFAFLRFFAIFLRFFVFLY